MTVAEKLQDFADSENIRVYPAGCHSLHKGCCHATNDFSAIVINTNVVKTHPDYVCTLAEEIGHIKTGTMLPLCDYVDPKYKNWIKRKNEIHPVRYAINWILPPSRIQEARDDGCYCVCAIAQFCGVTEEFLMEALDYYGWN